MEFYKLKSACSRRQRLMVTAALLLLALPARAQVTLPDRTMGSLDPKANAVLDAQAQGIRVLPPVRLYPKGGAGFENWPGRLD